MAPKVFKRKRRNIVTVKGISDTTHRRLKVLSLAWGKPMYRIVEEAIEQLLKTDRARRAVKELEKKLGLGD